MRQHSAGVSQRQAATAYQTKPQLQTPLCLLVVGTDHQRDYAHEHSAEDGNYPTCCCACTTRRTVSAEGPSVEPGEAQPEYFSAECDSLSLGLQAATGLSLRRSCSPAGPHIGTQQRSRMGLNCCHETLCPAEGRLCEMTHLCLQRCLCSRSARLRQGYVCKQTDGFSKCVPLFWATADGYFLH